MLAAQLKWNCCGLCASGHLRGTNKLHENFSFRLASLVDLSLIEEKTSSRYWFHLCFIKEIKDGGEREWSWVEKLAVKPITHYSAIWMVSIQWRRQQTTIHFTLISSIKTKKTQLFFLFDSGMIEVNCGIKLKRYYNSTV